MVNEREDAATISRNCCVGLKNPAKKGSDIWKVFFRFLSRNRNKRMQPSVANVINIDKTD
jgi:hypothetical protein